MEESAVKMKRFEDLVDNKVNIVWSEASIDRFYATMVKIIEEKFDVTMKYTVRKKTPEELAEEAKNIEPYETCVEEALMLLTDQEIRVLGLRLGYANIPQSRKDLEKHLGISAYEIKKIENAALEKLRAPDQFKKLHRFLYQALSFRGFDSTLFAAIFKLKEENIDNILKAGPSSLGEDQIYVANPHPWARDVSKTQNNE